jgi:hypothetical protein
MENYGLIELGLVFGAVLTAAVWELYSVRKGIDRRRKDKNESENDQRGP